MIATLLPVLAVWWSRPTALASAPPPIPAALRWTLLALAGGVLLSGLRDLYAAAGLPRGAWPWGADEPRGSAGAPAGT